jgi:hypothetical protein
VLDDCEPDPLAPQPADVEAEYKSKARLTDESRDWLLKVGVPATAIEDVAECTSGLVRQLDGRVRFEIDPDEDVARAYVTAFHVPVMRDGAFVDLIRFKRTHPRAKIHGGRVCRRVNFIGEPLEDLDENGHAQLTPIWWSPLNWLKANRRGLVYCRMSWPYSRTEILRKLAAIQCEDLNHAIYVERMVWSNSTVREQMPLNWAWYLNDKNNLESANG